MARLPQPGGDAGNWGEILNDYLSQSLNSDGSIKNDTVGAPQLKPQSVTSAAIADGHITAPKLAAGAAVDGQVLSYDNGNLDWITPPSGSGPITAADITDSTTVGRAVLTAVDAASARSTIGAGTSNLTIGTSSSTAKAGDYQPTADQVVETTDSKVLTATERTKLAGITVGATANASDAQLRDRSTHTGTQPLSTISDVTASAAEVNYMQGTTSSVQTQLNSKGNVSGPISATNNALARFDTTTGKLLKSSSATLDDVGLLTTTSATTVQLKTIGTTNGVVGGSGVGIYNDGGAVQTSNNRLGFVLFGGLNEIGGALQNSAGFFAYADATWSPTSSPTRIEFEVAPIGSNARATAMTIKSSGNVGIGVSPSAKLDVAGEARVSTAGTTATSVVNVGGTQTLSGKTMSGISNVFSNIAQSSVTNLTTDLSTKTNASTILSNGMGVVVHGATAATARPTEFAVITWIGSVTPTNAATNDIWIYKA